jgi:hypothetical protein
MLGTKRMLLKCSKEHEEWARFGKNMTLFILPEDPLEAKS